jgi:hypothetical protein
MELKRLHNYNYYTYNDDNIFQNDDDDNYEMIVEDIKIEQQCIIEFIIQLLKLLSGKITSRQRNDNYCHHLIL